MVSLTVYLSFALSLSLSLARGYTAGSSSNVCDGKSPPSRRYREETNMRDVGYPALRFVRLVHVLFRLHPQLTR